MTEQVNTVNEKSFKVWFWLFVLVTIALIGYYRGPSVASAHSLIGMVLIRQMSHIWKTHRANIEQEFKILELTERMDKIDPYKD